MSVLSALRADFLSAKLPRAVAMGGLMGAVIVIHCFALATIVFSGPLLPFALHGAGMMLFGGAAFCLLAGLTSGYGGMLAVPQEVPATVLGALGAAVVAGTVNGPDEAPFMTMAALLILSGLFTGLFFLAIGHLRLSNLFRFIPYPVAGGFFAGTGWVLSLAALSVMSGVTVDWQTLPRILEPAMVWKWGPGAAYGLVLFLIMKRRNSFAVMMGSVVVATGLYHLGLVFLDISVEEAKAQGLLLSGMPQGGLWPAFGLSDLAYVDWSVVAVQVPNLLTVTVVTLLCLLVYLNGLELATGMKIDLDREFRVAGLAGMCAGAGGSAPGCQAFVFTLPCWRFGADTPWTGVVAAFVLGMTLFFGGGILELLPKSVIGGLLLYIGVDLLDYWLRSLRKRLHWTDYGIVLLICVTIAVFGFIEGVGAGMIAMLALFAFRLSRVDVVREEFTGRERHSNKIRSVPDRAILLERGERIRAYRLRGYVFFGSAHPLVNHLKRPLDETPPPACILLDFTAISGCDFSATNALCEFIRSADSTGTRVVISAVSRQIEESLQSTIPGGVRGKVRFERDLDHGLERCEDMVIAMAEAERTLSGAEERSHGRLLERVADDLERHLDEQVFFEEMLDQLTPWLESRGYQAGVALAALGEVQEGLQLLVSGRASVHDAEGTRLFQCGPGDVIEPRAAFGAHAAPATTIAQDPCRTMMLTPIGRKLLESDDKELSLKLYGFLISRPPPGGLSLEIS